MFSKIKDSEQRSIERGWSMGVLEEEIKFDFYSKHLNVQNNFTKTIDVKLPNKDDLLLYLSKKFEIITAVLEIIKNASFKFPDSVLILYYDNGKDEESEEDTLPSLILYVKNDFMTKEAREQIRALCDPYEEIFARYNAFFHTEPYLVNYV